MNRKLTNKIRAEIVNAVSKAKFDHLIADAKRVLNKAIDEYMSQSQAATIPTFLIKDGWIYETDNYLIRRFFTQEEYEKNAEDGSGNYEVQYYTAEGVFYPIKAKEYRIYIKVRDYDPTDTIADGLRKLQQIESSKKDFSNDVDKIVSAVTTVSALLKLMPELEPYIPSDSGLPDTRLVSTGLIDKVRNIINE